MVGVSKLGLFFQANPVREVETTFPESAGLCSVWLVSQHPCLKWVVGWAMVCIAQVGN